MELEFVADPDVRDAYPFDLRAGTSPGKDGRAALEIDWRPTIEAILRDRPGTPEPVIAARFHNTLAEAMVRVAREIGRETVVLSGGCFQNRLLTRRAVDKLQAAGHRVLLHRQVPPGDGGICLGQIAVAAAHLQDNPATL
jgi:hydrogenase maturation protein HypF